MTPTARNKGTAEERTPAVGFPGEEGYSEGDWSDVDDFSAGANPAVSFDFKAGSDDAKVTGIVIGARTSTQRDMVTGDVKTFANGDPRRQLIVTLATGRSDDDDDDGTRDLYVKGSMVRQWQAAMRAAKVRGVRPGGELTVAYVSDGEPTAKGLNPPKVYEITYVPPTA